MKRMRGHTLIPMTPSMLPSLSPDAHLSLLGAKFDSADLSLSSVRSFASHWSSSSNSLVELLLAGLDAVGLLSPLWRADTLHWIVDRRTFSCLDRDSSMVKVIFFDIPDRGTCQRQGTNGCWHLDCWTWPNEWREKMEHKFVVVSQYWYCRGGWDRSILSTLIDNIMLHPSQDTHQKNSAVHYVR